MTDRPRGIGAGGAMKDGVIHRIAHLFGWNGGRVETWWEPGPLAPSKLMVGFRCAECGQLSGVHESYAYRNGRDDIQAVAKDGRRTERGSHSVVRAAGDEKP